jgi:hypothetical protein
MLSSKTNAVILSERSESKDLHLLPVGNNLLTGSPAGERASSMRALG